MARSVERKALLMVARASPWLRPAVRAAASRSSTRSASGNIEAGERPGLAEERVIALAFGAVATASRSRAKAKATRRSDASVNGAVRGVRGGFGSQQIDQPFGRVGQVDFVGGEAAGPAVGAISADGRGERDVAAAGADVQARP